MNLTITALSISMKVQVTIEKKLFGIEFTVTLFEADLWSYTTAELNEQRIDKSIIISDPTEPTISKFIQYEDKLGDGRVTNLYFRYRSQKGFWVN